MCCCLTSHQHKNYITCNEIHVYAYVHIKHSLILNGHEKHKYLFNGQTEALPGRGLFVYLFNQTFVLL